MTLKLRSASTSLDIGEVEQMLKKYDFFDRYLNPLGKGIQHNYEAHVINGDKIINDHTNMLTWQQSGSTKNLEYVDVEKYIVELNARNFADFSD